MTGMNPMKTKINLIFSYDCSQRLVGYKFINTL